MQRRRKFKGAALLFVTLIFLTACATVPPRQEVDLILTPVAVGEPSPIAGYVVNDAFLNKTHTALVERDECFERLDKETNIWSRLKNDVGILLLGMGVGYLANTH